MLYDICHNTTHINLFDENFRIRSDYQRGLQKKGRKNNKKKTKVTINLLQKDPSSPINHP